MLVRKTITGLLIVFFLYGALFADDKNIPHTLKRVIPAVVSVYAADYSNHENAKLFLQSSLPDGSTGSGVVVSKDGLIVTNNHVINGKPYIKVVLSDNRVFQAKLVSYDPTIDLAIIKIDIAEGLVNPIQIGSSKAIEIGETVLAIGNPFGIGISVSSGIISALPSKSNLGIGGLIQTDALLNPGNSGGALVDTDGNLIGINTFIFGKQGISTGIGFAIPSDLVKLFVDRTLSGKKVKQYWLGLAGVNVTDEIAKKLNLDMPDGVMVTAVYPNASAEKAGIKTGDVILQIGDAKISSVSYLSYVIASLEDEVEQEVLVFRDGELSIHKIKPEIPEENIPSQKTILQGGLFDKIEVANNSYAIGYELGINPAEKGVVIYKITEGSFITKKLPSAYGIVKGDIIQSINGTSFDDVDSLLKFISENSNIRTYNIVLKRYNTIIEFNIFY